MSMIDLTNSKTIDDLQELGKLSGSEKTIISDGQDTKKVSIDTIVGYAASLLTQQQPVMMAMSTLNSVSQANCIVFIPEGEEIPVSQRALGCFYIEEKKQTSIRTQINIPTSVKVSGNLGLKRI